jgi:hypothetical protein
MGEVADLLKLRATRGEIIYVTICDTLSRTPCALIISICICVYVYGISPMIQVQRVTIVVTTSTSVV